MEPSELVSDDDEHPERLSRVLRLGQKVRRKAEGQRDLRGLVEVRLKDVPIYASKAHSRGSTQ